MMRGELFHQRGGQSVPHHQQEGDHDVVVALVVVQLRVALEDVEDDVDELLLQTFSLVIRHPCGDSTGGGGTGCVTSRHLGTRGEDLGVYRLTPRELLQGEGAELAEKIIPNPNPPPRALTARRKRVSSLVV